MTEVCLLVVVMEDPPGRYADRKSAQPFRVWTDEITEPFSDSTWLASVPTRAVQAA
jgi:hypothetical protein